MFGVLRPHTPVRERPSTAPNASPPPPHSLAPIPSTVFRSREELLEGCKDWSATQGYAIVIARSRVNRLWLKCDRGGTYENRRNLMPDQRKRKRADSRLLGCPFKVIAAHKKDGSWTVDTEIGNHNHEPSDDLSAHPTLRRMTDQQLQKVHDMCDAGRSPAETLEELKAVWPGIKVLTRDIYNARKKYKTLKEEAEAAAELSREQPYQDPNELGLNGPSPNGRWAWVPEGEEVTNKKAKKRRKDAKDIQQSSQPALDPHLQTQASSSPSAQATPSDQLYQNAFNNLQKPALKLRWIPQKADSQSDLVPPNQRHNPSTADGSSHLNRDQTVSRAPIPHPPSLTQPVPNQSNASSTSPFPSHIHQSAAPTASMSSNMAPASGSSPLNGGAPAAASTKAGEAKAQVLMSRIERMEKEQRDQKDMLAQILGAVQGIRRSPGEEARA